jgi:hypothetical protein
VLAGYVIEDARRLGENATRRRYRREDRAESSYGSGGSSG